MCQGMDGLRQPKDDMGLPHSHQDMYKSHGPSYEGVSSVACLLVSAQQQLWPLSHEGGQRCRLPPCKDHYSSCCPSHMKGSTVSPAPLQGPPGPFT
mmetsp:Transcript_33962/g.75293  ORF Transcript_33962/g.75293 Transcript_33962/m.75293 type:complete len:96 (-) Transcript_33962:17-304(-)